MSPETPIANRTRSVNELLDNIEKTFRFPESVDDDTRNLMRAKGRLIAKGLYPIDGKFQEGMVSDNELKMLYERYKDLAYTHLDLSSINDPEQKTNPETERELERLVNLFAM